MNSAFNITDDAVTISNFITEILATNYVLFIFNAGFHADNVAGIFSVS